jgi:hypothetical protein
MSVEGSEKQKRLIFASIIFPRKSSETNALLLAESIRTFAGALSQAPIWFFAPETKTRLSSAVRDKLLTRNVTLIPFEIDPEVAHFPFTRMAVAAALAESKASGQADLLAWLSANTVVLQEPKEFLLQHDKSLGYRPVHHALIGSRYDEPLDAFWTRVYRYCNVPDDRVFPMTTHVDNVTLRPYFNAGCHITRPEEHLLRNWRDTFLTEYREPLLQRLYKHDERYKVFIHQAIFSGVALSTLATDKIHKLPPTYNYPLHLHAEDVTDHRPSSLEEVVTFRHEAFYQNPEWRKKMPAREPLKRWIAERLLP